ncbi:uncharacterized protein LOC131432607 [Malaya genurostris]|uniref:uncharacterized protein LOC131432607 n=1 Tax=Malaya genurostris TaxID=325434 RepID=UPI0026F3CC41|nr:uncharacterized protein LOC131432607 [Malaya genurostris]
MITMRALVATVLLISVVLVSIVLITANTRHVVDADQAVNGSAMGPALEEVFVNQIPLVEPVADEGPDSEELSSKKEATTVPKKVPVPIVTTEDASDRQKARLLSVFRNSILGASRRDDSITAQTSENFDETSAPPIVATDAAVNEDELIILDDLYTDGKEIAVTSEQATTWEIPVHSSILVSDIINSKTSQNSAENKIKAQKLSTEKTLKLPTTKQIKSLPNASQTITSKTFQTTEQLPLGFEPGTYVSLDTKTTNDVAEELDPINWSISSPTLGRKQRDARKPSETIVLNTVPIAPHTADADNGENDQLQGCPHKFPPPFLSMMAQPVDRTLYPNSGLPSIYNPYNWNTQNMNLIKFPQCLDCQRKSVPLCTSCGRCRDCCHQSGCTCGCLKT